MNQPFDSHDEAPSVPVLERIDRVCQRFEAAWKTGPPPLLEEYLCGVEDTLYERLFGELLLLDVDYRRRDGEVPAAAEYRARFPDDGDLVERVFARSISMEPSSAPPSNASPPGDYGETLPFAFGEYDLLELIGEGGMGAVYRARQRGADRIVALKVIRPDRLTAVFPNQRQEAIRRFRVEALAAAKLEHDHIVTVFDVGHVDGQPFFSMRYVKGRDLDELLRAGPMEPRAAAALLEPVARAVHFAHRSGVVHRDLKPRNILLDESGRPFVVDFGLAKSLEASQEVTMTEQLVGTPAYMSPEQAAHEPAGPASDVFSLGATLYEMITGRSPFCGDSLLDTLTMIRGSEPALPRSLNPRVPRGLELICLKCLAKSPDDRYASADELADDLRRFVRDEVLHVRPPRPIQRVWSWMRRRPALTARLGALAAFYLMGTVVFLTKRGSDSYEWAWFFGNLSIVIPAWAVASIVCQRLFEHKRWAIAVAFAWGVFDSAAFLTVLLLAHGAASPLVIGYALLVAGSGIWLRERLVWFMTGLSLLSYVVLIVDCRWRRPELLGPMPPDRHAVVLIALVILGASIAFLVRRVRTLSRFYGE